MTRNLVLSSLAHTWIFDVDGTVCVHNGYKHGGDVLLDGVKEFFAQIPPDDMVVFITSRNISEKKNLEKFLTDNGLRFDHIIFNAPMGERILINDDKPGGLKCARAVNKKRNGTLNIRVSFDKGL